MPPLSREYLTKLLSKFTKHQTKTLNRPQHELRISNAEAMRVVCDVFGCRCALTGRYLHDPQRPQFCLVRYDATADATVGNVLFAIEEAARRHEADGIDALPPPLRREIDRCFAEGLGLGGSEQA